jgi:uncharacterized repeat protein (TIGR01451 family)
VDLTNVLRSTVQTSAPITVQGINAPTAITVSGGTYSINGGSFTASAGNVSLGDQVRARHTSSASFSTAVGTTVTIGGEFDTFTSTTEAADSTPNAFSFVDQIGVVQNSTITSAPITVAGINTAAAISVSGGTYSKNNGAFTAVAGTVVAGDEIRARHTSSASFNTTVNTTVDIAGVSDVFSSTTLQNGANAVASKTDGKTQYNPGETLTYTIVISNAGSVTLVNATVTDMLPVAIASATWTCAASGGATCTVGGSGNISDSVTLPLASFVTYTVTAQPAPSATGVISNTVTVGLTGGQVDISPGDNSATDTTTSTRVFGNGFE